MTKRARPRPEAFRRAVRQHVEALMDLANDPVVLFDYEFNVVDANDRAVETYGYERGRFLTLTLEDLHSPEAPLPIAAAMEKVKREDGLVQESVHRRKGGVAFAVECRSRLLEFEGVSIVEMMVRDICECDWTRSATSARVADAQGENVGVQVLVDDIPGRRTAEEDLAASERFLDNIIEHSPHSLWIADREGTMIRLNQACRELLHVADEEVVGKYNLFKDNIVESHGHMPLVRRVFEAGETAHFTLYYDSADLHSIHLEETAALVLEVTISAVAAGDGRVVNAVVQHVDVTARERALGELRESEQQLQMVFSTSPTGIFVSRAEDGMLMDVNQAFVELFGVDRREVIGRSSVDLGVFVEAAARERMIEELRRNGRVKDHEMKVRTRQGEILTALVSAAPLERGGEQCLIGTISDITERKAVENQLHTLTAELERRVEERTAELRASNAELEAFSYSVSHDLRAPLRHISGYAGMLEADYGDALDEQAQRYIQSLARSVREMGVLIDELLEFSRAGRVDLSMARVSMDALVREVLESLQGTYVGREIEWNVAALPDVWGDETLLRQVWQNLLENAVKYTRPRGHARIAIEASATSTEYEFGVRDNGVGFDMQYADKLFGVFQRLQADPQFEGVGIGLANVRRIIARHGGRAWGEGAVGEGAVFRFSLPGRGS